MRKATRRAVIAGGLALAAGAGWWWRGRKPPLGMELADDVLARGAALIEEHTAVDVHSHPGRFFLTGASPVNLAVRLMRDGYEAQRIADMAEAGVTASLFAIVADLPVLGLGDGGLSAVRAFEPGEAYADYRRQLDRLQGVIDSGLISAALTPGDVRRAKKAGKPVAILASEGADFVEDRLERVAEAFDAGLRAMSLVHYNSNRFGDIQTGTPVHEGLTPLGRQLVREMNRAGMIVDAAHASYRTCVDIVAASHAPVMLSHSNLNDAVVQSPRFLSNAHARLIADTGGLIGAWPAGIGSRSLADFADQILALVDAVGAEHVGIGTDMDGNYKPVLTEYRDFPLLAALLLHKGMSETGVAGVIGGNFLRLFDDVAGRS